ncbi:MULTISPECIES: hypothetical protein [Burkholderia cepacia complex]|nr:MULTISPECIES: hypothetical protein [Burkholderia cepacia complex]
MCFKTFVNGLRDAAVSATVRRQHRRLLERRMTRTPHLIGTPI